MALNARVHKEDVAVLCKDAADISRVSDGDDKDRFFKESQLRTKAVKDSCLYIPIIKESTLANLPFSEANDTFLQELDYALQLDQKKRLRVLPLLVGDADGAGWYVTYSPAYPRNNMFAMQRPGFMTIGSDGMESAVG